MCVDRELTDLARRVLNSFLCHESPYSERSYSWLVAGSDDSEYESAAEASFVEPKTPQPSRTAKSDTGLDFLINGLTSFNLVTPGAKRPNITFQFPSPAKLDESEVFDEPAEAGPEVIDDEPKESIARPVANLDDSFMSAFNKLDMASSEVTFRFTYSNICYSFYSY